MVVYNSSINILQYVVILIMTILILTQSGSITMSVLLHLIDGKPTMLIQHGNWFPKPAVLLVFLAAGLWSCAAKAFSTKQVKRAVIEQNGQMIIVQVGEENPKYPLSWWCCPDWYLSLLTKQIIIMERLAKDGYTDISNIFIAEYESGNLNVVTY